MPATESKHEMGSNRMSDAASDPGAEAGAGATPTDAKRPKSTPKYHVYLQTEDGTWDWLTETNGAVEGVSRKDAVRNLENQTGKDLTGRFKIIREFEVKPLSREVETKVQDAWA